MQGKAGSDQTKSRGFWCAVISSAARSVTMVGIRTDRKRSGEWRGMLGGNLECERGLPHPSLELDGQIRFACFRGCLTSHKRCLSPLRMNLRAAWGKAGCVRDGTRLWNEATALELAASSSSLASVFPKHTPKESMRGRRVRLGPGTGANSVSTGR